jgi:hypothetical protein
MKFSHFFLFCLQSIVINFREKLLREAGQGDRIGRIFDVWAIAYFDQLFEIKFWPDKDFGVILGPFVQFRALGDFFYKTSGQPEAGSPGHPGRQCSGPEVGAPGIHPMIIGFHIKLQGLLQVF